MGRTVSVAGPVVYARLLRLSCFATCQTHDVSSMYHLSAEMYGSVCILYVVLVF